MPLRALVLAAVVAVAFPGTAAAKRKPDLKVTSGSVAAAGDQLQGSFKVRNVGRRKAGKSTAALFVGAGANRHDAGQFPLRSIKRKLARKVLVSVAVPSGLSPGSLPIRACADVAGGVAESKEGNNCRKVGTLEVSVGPSGGAGNGEVSDPVTYNKDEVFTLNDGAEDYYVYVPQAYDDSHQTPIRLLVWSHGCGGESAGDIYTVSPGGDQSYIAITVTGREGDCWKPGEDGAKLLQAIANLETHFNIDRHRIVLGGYSSGGDLSYRTAFYNSTMFAGLLAENTSPFRDTGSSQEDSIAAATFKFNIVHLAHTEDKEYPIAGVRKETKALKDAGFPIQVVERAGEHYEPDTDTTGSDHDLRTILLPHMQDDWQSP